jgi:hypothetical protein
MEKLRLDLDALTVESFEATEIAGERGTVNGAQSGCSCAVTCGIASEGPAAFEQIKKTLYACCV